MSDEMTREELIDEGKMTTIFDLIIFAYSQIAGIREDQYYCEYLSMQQKSKDEVWKDINISFEELLNENISVKTFYREIEKIKPIYRFCLYVHLLVIFDNVLVNREQYSIFRKKFSIKKDNIKKTGPMMSSFSNYKLYYLFHKEAYIRNNIIDKLEIRTRKIRSGIWEYIENYIIIDDSEAYHINVYEYQKNNLESVMAGGHIKIGIVPNGRKQWFQEKKRDDSYEIMIQENEREIDFLNEVYISSIQKADAQGVNVIIFPELAMNSKTIDSVKKYLAKRTLTGEIKNLKFIFMGSLWKDRHNICYIMSSQGTLLLENEKKKAYVDKTGKMEYLEVLSNEINLIDIKGLGRVWYSICKDALEHRNVTNIYHNYGVHLSVISAFSPSIDPFITEAETVAKEYYGSCIVSNACRARKNDIIGFLSLPGVSVNRNNSRCKIYDYKCPHMLQEKCTYNCIHIYDFDLNEIEESEDMKSIKFNKKCIDIT